MSVPPAARPTTARVAHRRWPTPLAWLPLLVIGGAMWAPPHAFGQARQITDVQLDGWIFQQQRDPQGARQHLEAQLKFQVERLTKTYGLSEDQQRRIQLAGSGDIERFFNRVLAAHEELTAMEADRADINKALQLAAPLQQELSAGLLGEDSLFAKNLPATLDAEQLEQFRRREAMRRQQKLESCAKMVILELERGLPLTDTQRERLVELAIAHRAGGTLNNQHLSMRIQYGLFMLPDETLNGILDSQQLAAFRKRRAQLRGAEQVLRQQGVLVDEPE